MNFFLSQERARRTSRRLVATYLLALFALVVVSSWVLVILLRVLGVHAFPPQQAPFYYLSSQDWTVFAVVALFVIGGALISSYLRGRALSKGGYTVALSLGGRKIQPNTSDFKERQALNVVEEMAIASGMPVPEVYVLPNEQGINAFAAGLTPTDAVIGLTQGAVNKLSRAQLQGVVGHEFSHILNGDMRLNIRLIMLISGIEFVGVLGRIFTQSGRSSRRFSQSRRRSSGGNGAIVLAGIVLRLLGWIGVLMGRVIQAAVSRQREFLADASAVQFTRNPLAVADALKTIGAEVYGSRLRHTDVTQVSHLFFAQAFHSYLDRVFATHPPLEQRIQLLDPNWKGTFLDPLKPLPEGAEPSAEPVSEAESKREKAAVQILATAAAVLEALPEVPHDTDDLPAHQAWQEWVREPTEAMAWVAAILLPEWAHQSESQNRLDWAQTLKSTGLAPLDLPGVLPALSALKPRFEQLAVEDRLPLIEHAMPALKSLSRAQYDVFRGWLHQLVESEGGEDIFRQTVYRLVTRFLDVHFGLEKPYPVRYRQIRAVALEVQLLMSMLAHYGHPNSPKRQVEQAYLSGMQAAGLNTAAMAQMPQYRPADFEHATEKLAHASLALKQQILSGLIACVQYDARVADVERELLLAIAATMEAPISRLNF